MTFPLPSDRRNRQVLILRPAAMVMHALRTIRILLALVMTMPVASQIDAQTSRIVQRQARNQGLSGLRPPTSIDSRIRNRVQSRIRNRIDRDYDPQANALSPFTYARDQTRTGGRR